MQTNSKPTIPWDPDLCKTHPGFLPLSAGVQRLGQIPKGVFPSLKEIHTLLWPNAKDAPHSGAGIPLMLSPDPSHTRRGPKSKDKTMEDLYIPSLFLLGQLFTRANNWHDLFNALVWYTFPETKAALTRRQFFSYDAIAPFPWGALGRDRPPEQDSLTLFDEGGLIILCCDETLSELLTNRQWKDIFFKQRNKLQKNMNFLIFGHAIYEEILRQHQHVHCSGVIIKCAPEILQSPLTVQLKYADTAMRQYLAKDTYWQNTKSFIPTPIFGIPDWHKDNKNEDFYVNSSYFR